MNFRNIIVAYFVIGAVMWGGGAILWEDSGIGQFFIESPSEGELNENTQDDLESMSGPIQQAASQLQGSGLLAIWNILVKLIGSLFWPIIALQGVNAPPRVWVLFGGAPTVAFFGAVIALVRGST
jgi:hypothetical protein